MQHVNDAPPTDGLFDAKGRWVPRKLIKEVDLLRHELVLDIAAKAHALSEQIERFRFEVMADLQAFLDLSAEKYETTYGGAKGNVTLMSYDGRFKVQRSIADHLVFDERLAVAKRLVDECIHRWSQGSSDEIRALVEHAFQVDKQGKVSTERVLGLRRLEITDPQWLEAMQAISDSVQVASSKSYLRVYERVEIDGVSEYRPIALDVAAVGGGR